MVRDATPMPLGNTRLQSVIFSEGNYTNVCGIGGATILGNGTAFSFKMSLDSLKEPGLALVLAS